jgi:hypothetical protein
MVSLDCGATNMMVDFPQSSNILNRMPYLVLLSYQMSLVLETGCRGFCRTQGEYLRGWNLQHTLLKRKAAVTRMRAFKLFLENMLTCD